MAPTDNHDDTTPESTRDAAVAGAGELATVHPLRQPESTSPVVEGEVVSAEEWALLTSQRAQAAWRYQQYRDNAVAVARFTRTAVTHQRTKVTAKLVARNVFIYPGTGVSVLCKRWRDAHGATRYERMMRAAEAAGDREMLMEWEARDVAEKQRRHDRVQDWVKSPKELVKAVAMAIGSVAVLLLVLGVILAIADKDAGRVLDPIVGMIDLVGWIAWSLSAYGAFLLVGGTALVLGFLWNTGRQHAEPPAWMAPTTTEPGDPREVIPDEGAILNALRNLNLAPLNRKIKEGWTPRWVLATGRDGKGWRTQLELPAGVTVEMINDKRAVLAHNLVRLPVEVWPIEPKRQPGVLDLWVADQGILTGPVDPYPLLTDGTADYFTGVPVGIDQRGQEVIGRLMASNYAAAGIMGSGKTSLVHNILCGAMLDPLVSIEVYVMAFNADYDAMAPVLTEFVKGDEDTQVEAAIQALRNLRAEVTERGKILSDLGGDETKLTREIAERDLRMRPKVVVFDECQEMFRHEKYGNEAKELAIKVMMKARKCGLTLVFVTPAPSADSLPRDLAKTVSHRVCFAIGDHQGNDAILGTGAHKQGITATNLVAGEDIGTAMASGFAARPGLLRTHHIRKEKGVDEITPIVERALELRKEANVATGGARLTAAADRDLIIDLLQVIGEKPVGCADAPALLRDLAPGHAPYQKLNGKELRALLAAEGIQLPSTNRVYPISADTLREYLADQDDEGTDDED